MSFRYEVFQAVGGFRGEIGRVGMRPVGCEETELCIRLSQQQSSRQLLCEPRSRVYHHVPVNRARGRYFVSRCFSEGLSKAMVSHLVGANDGLSSEWAYTFQTLPRGVMRGLSDVIRHRDLAGLARSAAIGTGLIITTVGYVYGVVSLRLAGRRAINSSAPLSREQA
jgi:hypothetical protein